MSVHSDSASTRDAGCSREVWDAPLLITGCPRTGTTALAQWLSSHDKICIFNEFSLYHHPPASEVAAWKRIQEMRDDNPPPLKISRDMKSLRANLAAELPTPASNEVTANWLFGRSRTPLSVYGDKMPFLYLKLMEEIAERLPGVRFLVTLRDGRAVIASQIRQYNLAVKRGVEPDNWMRPTVEEAEYLWLRSARKWLSLRADPPAPCLEVRYEEATRSPEAIAKSICEFVGMEYERVEFREFLEEYRPVRNDVWREEIPTLEARLSHEFREALEQLGYE